MIVKALVGAACLLPVMAAGQPVAMQTARCGPVRSPERFNGKSVSVRDVTPRDPLALKQDHQFRRFHRLITAARGAKAVTATLTGRFDAVETQPSPGDAASRCCPSGGLVQPAR